MLSQWRFVQELGCLVKYNVWLYLFIYFFTTLFVCGCDGDAASQGDLQDLPKKVQAKYGLFYNSAHDLFKLDRGREKVNLSTGALYCPQRYSNGVIKTTDKGNIVRGTCGLTFVSPHYAITAGHCVDIGSCGYPGVTLTVRQFDISNLDNSKLESAFELQNVSDTDFENWTFGMYLTPADGYAVTEYECTVEVLCGAGYGERNKQACSIEGEEFSRDIALVHCPQRENNAPYVDVADSISVEDPVRVHWFHEVVNLPLPNSCNEPQCDNANAHYNVRSSMSNNFHYMGFADSSRETQLFPLVSVPWGRNIDTDSDIDTATDTDSVVLPVEHAVATVGIDDATTDIWGCHGMSGSGAFLIGENGEEYYIGPAQLAGGNSALGSYLCESANATPGDALTLFGAPRYSRALADWALENDDFPLPLCQQDTADEYTPCGDAQSECVNQDYCDGFGACEDFGYKDTDVSCGAAQGECVNQDYCDGSGVCADFGFVAKGTICGEAATECSAQDSCDGFGNCVVHYFEMYTPCGGEPVQCHIQDSCNGAGECIDMGFELAGTLCNDDSPETTNDACNDSGQCKGELLKDPDSDDTDSVDTDFVDTDSDDIDSDDTDSDDTDSDDIDSVDTDSVDTDFVDTDSDDIDSDDTGAVDTDSDDEQSSVDSSCGCQAIGRQRRKIASIFELL